MTSKIKIRIKKKKKKKKNLRNFLRLHLKCLCLGFPLPSRVLNRLCVNYSEFQVCIACDDCIEHIRIWFILVSLLIVIFSKTLIADIHGYCKY